MVLISSWFELLMLIIIIIIIIIIISKGVRVQIFGNNLNKSKFYSVRN